MQDYRNIKVWQKSHHLALEIYDITNSFPKEEKFSLTNQLRRSSLSIAANIAEGCGKFTDKDFAHYLNISLGSANETDYFVLFARDMHFIDQDKYNDLEGKIGRNKRHAD